MTQWLKYLPLKYEDWSSDPQKSITMPGVHGVPLLILGRDKDPPKRASLQNLPLLQVLRKALDERGAVNY